jgi:hypothetical protein
VPNVMPRQMPYGGAPQHQQLMGPPGMHGGPGGIGGPPGGPGDPFIEEQVEMLAEKIEGLEGELRYAWRALDVLSQEYVKMWQRLEKMEGLLSEQQTVITQLIDLYSADSSDGGTNGLKSGGVSPSSVSGGSKIMDNRGQAVNDENFYKALNAVHGDANTDMQLALSASQSLDDFVSEDEEEDDGNGKVVFPPHRGSGGRQQQEARGQGSFTDFLKGFEKTKNGQKRQKVRRSSQGSDSDVDAKSVTSSVRSSLSANTVRSEEVGEFPLPGELSPGYDNATPPTPPTLQHPPTKQKKKKPASSPPQMQPKLKKSRAKIDLEAEAAGKSTTKSRSSGKKQQHPPATSTSPLTVIGGNYSFSMSDELMEAASGGGAPISASEDALGSHHVANGKPLYPSLQTAMRPQQQPQSPTKPATSGKSKKQKQPQRPPVEYQQSPEEEHHQPLAQQQPQVSAEKSRKLSLKEKRKLRAERELTPRDLELTAAAIAEAAEANTAEAVKVEMRPKKQTNQLAPTQPASSSGGPSPTGGRNSSESSDGQSVTTAVSPNKIEAGEDGNGSSNGSSNGVLMRTTSREFAVSRALGKYREKQKKVQQQSRNSTGSNSDSQEDLDGLIKTPKTSPPRISMIDVEMEAVPEAADQSYHDDDDNDEEEEEDEEEDEEEEEEEMEDEAAEAALVNLGSKLAEFGGSIKPLEEFEAEQPFEAEEQPFEVEQQSFDTEQSYEAEEQPRRQRPPTSSSSEEPLVVKAENYPPPIQRRPSLSAEEKAEKVALEASAKAEKAANDAAMRAEKAVSDASKQASGMAKSAFGLFGASKFGKFAREAAQAAQQAAKEAQQQQQLRPPSQTTSRSSSRVGSRRQSTEESIDTDDEWYKHEMRELEDLEHEKAAEKIKPSASVTSNMSHVLVELTSEVPRIESEACCEHDRLLRAKQSSIPGPPPPPRPSEVEIYPEAHAGGSSGEDHKKVIMRFQSSEDYDEEEEDESSHAKRKGRRGRSESSENDSDATQSGPDSLMEDTGGSSDNLLDSSNQEERSNKKAAKKAAAALAREAASAEVAPGDVALETSPTLENKPTGSQGSLSSRHSRKSSGSSGSSRRSQRSVKAANGDATASAASEKDEDYAQGGYYDENGEWVEASGYYDDNGDWVETGGYYDEAGEWVEYAGYYDDNGEWVEVEPPASYYETNNAGEAAASEATYYNDGGGGPDAELAPLVEETAEAVEQEAVGGQEQQQNETGYFLADRGVAVFQPQTQTTPRQNYNNKVDIVQLEGTTSFEDTTEDDADLNMEVGDDDDDDEYSDDSTEMGGEEEEEEEEEEHEEEEEEEHETSEYIEEKTHPDTHQDFDHHQELEQKELSIQEEQLDQSLGSGKQVKELHQNDIVDEEHGTTTTKDNFNDKSNEELLEEGVESNEKGPSEDNLESILAKREGSGIKTWGALRQTLKDRKVDFLEMVSTTAVVTIYIFYNRVSPPTMKPRRVADFAV